MSQTLRKANLPNVKYITLDNGYKVWTQRVGKGPTKVLLLHGGPGCTHEYLEGIADVLAACGMEAYLYDQLGS